MQTRSARLRATGRSFLVCAALLIAAVTLVDIHLTWDHDDSQRDCLACQVLHSPAIPQTTALPAITAPPSLPAACEAARAPHQNARGLLKPLRAPPSSSTV